MSARLIMTRYASAMLIALALVGMVRPAAAQRDATSGNRPSPAAILLAKQILDLKHVKDSFQPIIPGVISKARDFFLQTNFMFEKDLGEIAHNLEKQYQPRLNDMVDAAARNYASHFTEQELRQLLAFYQSPLGQKAIAEEPKVLDESMV
ncbi:DUF2059 domain-containing protein [Bradyrhizobium genosp. P]|uniref:DUF2059 domain-containing protein n=1 Tax=Bradyrhizobium genosp. P TaxID=83641 RepID=UPI003CE7B2C2